MEYNDVMGDSLRVAALSTKRSQEDIKAVIKMLQRPKHETSIENIEKSVSDIAPGLSKIVEALKPKNKAEPIDIPKLIGAICAVLMVIFAAITLVSKLRQPSDADVNRVLDRAIAEVQGERPVPHQNRHERRSAKHKKRQKPNRR